jgi:uncharacterized protein with PhoU and TrkA domain
LPVEADVPAIGHRLADLLGEGVRAMALVRGPERIVEPDPDMAVRDGDVLVLSGRADRIALVEQTWLSRPA